MISRVPISGLPSSADPVFDLLVDELIARLQAGEAPDWHILCKFTVEHKENRMNIAPSGLAGRLRGDREQQVIAEITE